MTMRIGMLSLLALAALGATPRPKPTLVVETTYVFGSPTTDELERAVIAFPPIVVEASSSHLVDVQATLRFADGPAWQTN